MNDERRAEAVALVERFWAEVWNPPYDLAAVPGFVTDDFVITSGGQDIEGPEAFVGWIRSFQAQAADLRLTAMETFSNVEATRVVSRWRADAVNGGMFGTGADGRPISFSGVAVWEIRWDSGTPRLAHNWVERSAYELFRELTAD